MSAFTDTQDLVDLLSNGQADDNLFALFYQDVLNTLGPTRWHTTTADVNLTQGTALISLPTDLLDLLAVIYDGRFLSLLELREVEVLNSGWRNQVGAPIGYIEEAEAAQTVELYPAPYTDSPPVATIIYVAKNLPGIEGFNLPILTLPIALLCLQREFVRESDHTDVEFSNLCGMLGQLLLDMLNAPENSL